MNWKIRLGHWFGIDVYLHFTFLLMLGFIAVLHWLPERSLGAAFVGTAFFAAIFVCVVLHEYGHALMARRFGVETKDIILLPIGGVARLTRIPEKPSHEFWIAVAGPAVNVVIMLLLGAWIVATGSFSGSSISSIGFAERLFLVNGLLVVFNLLPAFPMDGGRVLRSLLAMRSDYASATKIAGRIGQAMAVLFGLLGLVSNPFLILIAFFVWFGAAQEMTMVTTKAALNGIRAKDAMITEFRSLSPEITLSEVSALLLAGSQTEFPVIRNGEVIGVLDRTNLIDSLRSHGSLASVGQVMKSGALAAREDEAITDILKRVNAKEPSAIAVYNHFGQLVGLVTMDNISELIQMRAALGSADELPTRSTSLQRTTPPPLPSTSNDAIGRSISNE